MKFRFLKILLIIMLFLVSVNGSVYAKKKGKVWKEYKKSHFIVYYKKAPFDFVETVERAAEEYYVKISRNLGFTRYKGWSWDERAKIYIYDDADDYVESGKRAKWSHGVASPKDKIIRTFPSAHGFFDSTLPHELGHIIFREFIGFKARIPVWFEEGVAMRQEKAKRWGAERTVKKSLKNGTFIPLDELTQLRLYRDSDTALVSLFYAESASIVNFIINEYGKHRFVRLCRKLQGGGGNLRRPFPMYMSGLKILRN